MNSQALNRQTRHTEVLEILIKTMKINEDALLYLRARKNRKELIANILGGIILVVGGYIMVILINCL